MSLVSPASAKSRSLRLKLQLGMTPKAASVRPRLWLPQISANNFDEVIGRFLGGLRFPGHVVANVVLHEFAHKAADGATSGCEALQDVRTVGVLLEGALDGFELADDFLGAGNEIDFFASKM